jgi:uncharacterized protein YkwD
MKTTRRLVIMGLLACLLGLPMSAPAATPPDNGGEVPDLQVGMMAACYFHNSTAKAFISKHNKVRRSRGLVPLRADIQLGKVAKVHTKEMTSRNQLYHTSHTALASRVTRWSTLGENVGVGGTVDSLFSAFMASPGHKANILYSKFNHVGVGTGTSGGRLWVTVIFEARNDPGTRLC